MRASRHQVLTEQLLRQIAGGVFAVGDRLPTEEELSATHGLARGTVRQSLGRLEELGMIMRRPGSGTIVIAAEPGGGYRPLALSAADMVTLAADTKLLRPHTGEITLDQPLAARLRAQPGTSWFLLRGLRVPRRPGEPALCWSEHYQRPDIPREKLLHGDIIEADFGVRAVEQVISAGLISDGMAEGFSAGPPGPPVREGDPALVVTRRHTDRDGALVCVEIHTHPGDRYQITMTI